MKTRTYFCGASDSGCGNAFGITSREIASPNIELMSMATAVGLFKGVLGLVLVYGANRLANRLGERGLWT